MKNFIRTRAIRYNLSFEKKNMIAVVNFYTLNNKRYLYWRAIILYHETEYIQNYVKADMRVEKKLKALVCSGKRW